MRRFLVLAAALAGCTSPPVSMPADFPTLPAFATWEGVRAQATFYTNHEDIFDEDLMAAESVVPVALRIGMSVESGEASGYRVHTEKLDLRLYLPDGTALVARPFERVSADQDVNDRVTEEALKLNFLPDWEQSSEGFVFFELAPRDAFEVSSETTLLHRTLPLYRELSLSDALLTFVVTTDAGPRPIRVGLQVDRRTEDDA